MKLTVNGDINEYYVQTLCLLFFPASKFAKTDNATDGAPEAIVDVDFDGEKATATVTVSVGGKSVTKIYSEQNTGNTATILFAVLHAARHFLRLGRLCSE